MPFFEATIGLNVILSGAGQVLQLCYLVYEKQRLIKRYKEDCSKLCDFVQRVEVVLKATTAEADENDPGWQAALQALEDALKEVDSIFEDCATYGKIKSLLNADAMNTRLGAISQRLQLALAMIPIQKATVAEHKLGELRALQLDLQQAQWSASKAAEQQAEQLRRLADQNAVDAGISRQMLAEILALLKADAADKATSSSSSSQAAAPAPAATAAPAAATEAAAAAPQDFGGVEYSQLEAEKQELTSYMRELNLGSKKGPSQQEAPCLRELTSIIQAIDCLEHTASDEAAASAPPATRGAVATTTTSSSGKSSTSTTDTSSSSSPQATATATKPNSDLRPPPDLVCSITMDLFQDPVLLVGSGCTYERRAIEQWLAAGRTNDPETGVHLTDFTLAPNLAIRRQAREWLDRHPGCPRPAWQQQQQQGRMQPNQASAADQHALQQEQQAAPQQVEAFGAATAAAAGTAALAPAKPGQILKPIVLEFNGSGSDTASQAPAAVLYSQHQQQHQQQQHQQQQHQQQHQQQQSSVQSEKLQAQAAFAARVAAGSIAAGQKQLQDCAGEEDSVFLKAAAAAGLGHPADGDAVAAAAAAAPLGPAPGKAAWPMQCILLEQFSQQ